MSNRIKYIPFGLLVAALGCPESPNQPPSAQPWPRNLAWTVDTLEYPGSFQTLMRDIYAISASDVYIVGHNDQGRGKMYHFDGRGWTPVKLTAIEGGTITGAIDLSGIYGFGPQDIYAVGSLIDVNPSPPPNFLDSSLIIRFDGVQWSEVPIERSKAIFTVRGVNPFSVLAVGASGTAYYNDGAQWERIRERIFPDYGYGWMASIVPVSASVYYVVGGWQNVQGDSLRYYFWRFTPSQSLAVADSFQITQGADPVQLDDKFGVNSLWMSSEGILFSCGLGVFELSGTSWTRKLLSETYLSNIFGQTRNNLFVCGQFAKLFHFNGSEWYQFKQFELGTVWYRAVWTDGKEVFVIGWTEDSRKTIVLHGK